MSSVTTSHTHTAVTSEETAVSFGMGGTKHDVIIPAGTRCVKLEGGGGTPQWVVEDLSFIHDKGSVLYHDAAQYRITVEESRLADIASAGPTIQAPELRVVPAPEGTMRVADGMGRIMPEAALREQYKDLIFALQDAWGHIHGSRNEDLKTRAQAILSECGDFADKPPVISADLNIRIYRVLVDSKDLILGTASFASQGLRNKLNDVLDAHSSLAMERKPDILDVATAMDRVSWARRSSSTESVWWLKPEINDVVNEGVRAGYLHRPSTTQVEWSESGRLALRAAYADIARSRTLPAGEPVAGKQPDKSLSADEVDAISRLKASGGVAVRPSTSPGFGEGFDAYRLRENGSEAEILGSGATENEAWLSAAIRLAEYKPGVLQMTSREFGSVWTTNVLCKDGSLGILERRTRLEIRKLQDEYAVFSIYRRYLRGEDPCDVRQRQEDGRFVTLGQAADYVGRYIGDYAEAAADNRASAIEAQAESDAESASPSL
ncbi:hypothetical protein [Burkholderia sp. Tr-20390]|uniref:hypothetical protein n=1 Tax=Burkholderia sp. Tr-20390 TaxID=2703904 RepID=UPI0019820641|nr:hypothetical protein [Burkholderia sp. Tr-20390]